MAGSPSLVGQTVSHYRILDKLGAGGMGEVYRASDSRLGREVAIKILPEPFAADQQRMARFEREAQLLAALNHPNIATIYGLEVVGPTRALVMELVPGPTLADRIAQGPLPLDEALPIARQIAEAVEYAHESGIIHRDLKPANIKLTADGKVKLLDFGLAKALEDSPAAGGIDNSPTISVVATRAGIILGTAAYMSPEQAQGKRVDRRADIWAFGAVLYEMLSGKRLYAGQTTQETLVKVMTEEPNWKALPADVSAQIQRLVKRCLTKDPKQRLRDIGEARIALENVTGSVEEGASARASGRRRRAVLVAMGTAIVVLAALLGFALGRFRGARASLSHPLSLSIALPQGQSISGFGFAALAISADGKRVVYSAAGPNGQQLYLRDLESFRSTPIAGTQGAYNPFFSPDGEWIAFAAQGQLKKVALTGGAAQVVCDSSGPGYGGAWGLDGNIYFAPSAFLDAFRVSAAGGNPQAITKVANEGGASWPDLLPGGKTLLVTTWTRGSFDDAQIDALDLSTGKMRELIAGAAARFVPPHYLLYARAGNLMMARFDADRLEVQGTPVSVVSDLKTDPSFGAPQFAISPTGTLIYLSGRAGMYENNLNWIDRNGKSRPFELKPGLYQSPRFSPEGRKIAMTVRLPSPEIWIYDLDRGSFQQMTAAPGENEIPVWSPDGKQIAYAGNGRHQAYVFAVDGSSTERPIAEIPDHFHLLSWSPDGSLIALERLEKGVAGIWMLPTAGSRQPSLYLKDAGSAAFSPDGHWLAYAASYTSSARSVFIQSFPGPGEKVQVSTGVGRAPVWSRDGHELYYMAGNTLFAVRVSTAPKLVVGKPEVVYQGHFWSTNIAGPNYDVSPDGKQFLVLESDEESASTEIRVVFNWTAQLEN